MAEKNALPKGPYATLFENIKKQFPNPPKPAIDTTYYVDFVLKDSSLRSLAEEWVGGNSSGEVFGSELGKLVLERVPTATIKQITHLMFEIGQALLDEKKGNS